MRNIVKIADMIGSYTLSVSQYGEEKFNQLALDFERKILRGDNCKDYGLLGDTEYLNLYNDLTDEGVPQSQMYIDLINGKQYINDSGKLAYFSGIKQMLARFIYYEFLQKSFRITNSVGTFINDNENSTKVTKHDIEIDGAERYNEAVVMHNTEVYQYILHNQSLFPDWNFTRKGKFYLKTLI